MYLGHSANWRPWGKKATEQRRFEEGGGERLDPFAARLSIPISAGRSHSTGRVLSKGWIWPSGFALKSNLFLISTKALYRLTGTLLVNEVWSPGGKQRWMETNASSFVIYTSLAPRAQHLLTPGYFMVVYVQQRVGQGHMYWSSVCWTVSWQLPSGLL